MRNKKLARTDQRARDVVFPAIIATFLSLAIVVGNQLDNCGEILVRNIWTYIALIASFLISYYLSRLLFKKASIAPAPKFAASFRAWQIFLCLTAISLIVWLIAFPGVYGYDGIYQLRRFTNGIGDTHYSVFYTFIFGSIITAVKGITGSYVAAFALYSFLQLIFVNLVMTACISFLQKRINRKWFAISALIFFCLHLPCQLLAISSAQDVIFGGLFILLLLEFFKATTDSNYINKPRNWVSFAVIALLFCLSRNNGLFAVIPALLAAIVLVQRTSRLRFCFLFLVPLLLFCAYDKLLLPSIGIKKQPVVHESLSIPLMQMARAFTNHPDSFADNEKKLLKAFYPNCSFARSIQSASISDPLKACTNDEYVSNHLADYVSLWASIGLKNPKDYVESFGLMTIGAYYPLKKYPDTRMYHPFIEYRMLNNSNSSGINDGVEIARPAENSWLSMKLNSLFQKSKWQKIPIINILWGGGLYGLGLVIGFIYIVYRKQRKYYVLYIFILSLYATVLLSPVVLFRYLYPIILSTPVQAYMIFDSIPRAKRQTKKTD